MTLGIGPTDNLWKFLAVTGLIATIAAWATIGRTLERVYTELDALELETNVFGQEVVRETRRDSLELNWLARAITPYVDSVIAGTAKHGELTRIEGFKRQMDSLKAAQGRRQSRADMYAARLALVRSRASRAISWNLWLGALAGVTLSISALGFWNWYWLHQRAQDDATRRGGGRRRRL